MHFASLVPHIDYVPRRGGDKAQTPPQANRLTSLLKEAAGAVVYSVGLVILLIALLQLFHAR